ncbi:MAG: hypothetical protein CUN55_07270 [Phototrophicales bacterium]|nr:MAG: hypothetical protein CUN55_07270 [Phototrophicales bacterium]
MTHTIIYCPDWQQSPTLGEQLAPIETTEVKSLTQLLDLLRQQPTYNILFTQLTDIAILQQLLQQHPFLMIVVLDQTPSIETATALMKIGVCDYIDWQAITPLRLHTSYQYTYQQCQAKVQQALSLKKSLEHLRSLAEELLPQGIQLDAPLFTDLQPPTAESILNIRGVQLDEKQQQVSFHNVPIELSPTEFELLRVLMIASGQLVTFEQLAAAVHGVTLDRAQARTLLSAHISNLRNKLREAGCEHFIVNRRGRGYFIDTDAEIALQRRNLELRTITENIQDIIAYVDAEGIIEYVSPSVFKILGYEADQFIGASVEAQKSIVHPDDHLHMDHLIECLYQGVSCQYQIRGKAANAQWVWLEISADPVPDDNGGMIFVLRDCTARVDATLKLARSESRLRQLIEHSPDYIFSIDANARIQFINKAPADLHPQDLLGQSLYDYVAAEHREAIQQSIARAYTGQYTELMMHTTTINGMEWVNMRYVPMFNAEEVEEVMVIITDITLQQRALERLRKNNEQFKLLSEHMLDLVALHDRAGNFLYVSASCQRLLGYTEAELLGKSLFDICHPQDATRIQKRAHERILNGEAVEYFVYRAQRRNGYYIWLEANLKPIFNDQGEVVQFVSVSRDVSLRNDDTSSRDILTEYGD